MSPSSSENWIRYNGHVVVEVLDKENLYKFKIPTGVSFIYVGGGVLRERYYDNYDEDECDYIFNDSNLNFEMACIPETNVQSSDDED